MVRSIESATVHYYKQLHCSHLFVNVGKKDKKD